jgi:hypothetical protein
MAAESPNNKPSGRGGARPGAGRKPGVMEPKTIERMAIIEAFRDRVAKNADRLFNAQINLAEGTTHLFRIDKDSKGNNLPAVLVESTEEIRQYLDGETDDSYYYITTKQPDNRALDSMLDRAFGKAQQSVQLDGEVGVTFKVTRGETGE